MEKRASAGLTRQEGRRFGLTLGSAFALIAGVLWWRQHTTIAAVITVIGAALLAAAFLVPLRLGPVQRAWMSLGKAISRITTPLILSILYFGVITPIALMIRLFGTSPLHRSPSGGSFWVERPEGRRRSNLLRQF